MPGEYSSARGKHLEIRKRLHESGVQYDPDRLDDVDASVRRRLANEWIVQSNLDAATVLKALSKSDNLDDESYMERVKKFQKKHGLTEDGILWPNTLDVMHRETNGFTTFSPDEEEEETPETPVPETPTPTPAETTTPGTPAPVTERETPTTPAAPTPAETPVVPAEGTPSEPPAPTPAREETPTTPAAPEPTTPTPAPEPRPYTGGRYDVENAVTTPADPKPEPEKPADPKPEPEKPADPKPWFGDLHAAEAQEERFPPAKFIPLSDSPRSPLANTPPAPTTPEPVPTPPPEPAPAPTPPAPEFPPAQFPPTPGWIMH